MVNNKAKNKAVDEFMAKLEPDIQKLAKAIRDTLLKVEPKLTEAVKWGRPVYSIKSIVCAIDPYRKHVNLNFAKGTSLKDPANLLEGTGKNIRHIRIQKIEDMQNVEVKSLILEALELDKK